MSTKGVDTSQAFPVVLKLLPVSDMAIKKLACWYTVQQGQCDSELILLAVNTLVKDCSHPSPTIRCLALKTITRLPQRSLVEYWLHPLLGALHDSNAYVRRVAVLACIRLHEHHHELIDENNLVDTLYGMMRDPDPIVAVNCLTTLEELLQDEGGVVINCNIAHYLLNRLGQLTEWGVVYVLQLLPRYDPQTDAERLDIMNIVDGLLKHANSAVVVTIFHYLMFLVEKAEHLKADVFQRTKSQILHVIAADNAELTCVLLDFVQSILPDNISSLCDHYKTFFCRHVEPVYVKIRKLAILPALVSDVSIDEILDELETSAMDTDIDISRVAINSIGCIAHAHSCFADKCARQLLGLLEAHQDHVCSDVLDELRAFDFQRCSLLPQVLQAVSRCVPFVRSCSKGRDAALWFISKHGCQLDDAVHILEDFVDDTQDFNKELTMDLLMAGMRLFLVRPAECQELFGGVLEMSLRNDQPLLRDTALFYYRLLKTDVKRTKQILTL